MNIYLYLAAMKNITSIDAYIAEFPTEVQAVLQQVRAAIRGVVPEAEETIRYAIPTFRYKGRNLVHFAGFKNHIGFYATPDGHAGFEAELSKYKQGKGSVQFPLNQPVPLDLIREIVRFRAEQENRK